MISAIGFIFVLIIIAIIIGIVVATRSKDNFQSGSGTEGMSIARRVWLYLIALISLGILTAGAAQLLTLLFDVTIKSTYLTQVGATTFNRQQLSLGLAMLVIGGPLWFFFWRAIQRRVKGNQVEIGSAIRKLFLNFILLETAIMGITAASDFLKWLFSGVPTAEFSSSGLALFIVAAAIWSYHWRVSETEGQPSPSAKTLRRWYVYILSGLGLVWLTMGLVSLINAAVINLPVWEDTFIRSSFWDNAAQMSVAQTLLGGLIWYFHWFRMARGDFDSTLRQVYFYLLTIAGGAITALVALTILLFRVFRWAFSSTTIYASPQLQFLGWAVPTILLGLAIWGFHRRLVQEEAGRVQERRQSAQRIYFYLMSFLGLGTLVAGLSLIFGILIDLIVNTAGTSLFVTVGWWQTQLAVCLALLLTGTPLWIYYWNGILKRVREGGIEEWRALSRRIYLYVIIGASIVLLAADLVNIVYQLVNGSLQANFGINVLSDSKWSIQTLVVAAPLLWYHWHILRADQKRGAESVATHFNVTLLITEPGRELASRLENKLGFKIRVLRQIKQTTEPPAVLPDEEIDRLVNEIQSSPSNKVMLAVVGGKVTVLPYQDS